MSRRRNIVADGSRYGRSNLPPLGERPSCIATRRELVSAASTLLSALRREHPEILRRLGAQQDVQP